MSALPGADNRRARLQASVRAFARSLLDQGFGLGEVAWALLTVGREWDEIRAWEW